MAKKKKRRKKYKRSIRKPAEPRLGRVVGAMERLTKAVERQLGDKRYFRDILRGESGAAAGYPGFTYYKDTVDFYEDNKEDIFEVLVEDAEQSGMNIPEFMATWNTIPVDHETFANVLAWYALERVAMEKDIARKED